MQFNKLSALWLLLISILEVVSALPDFRQREEVSQRNEPGSTNTQTLIERLTGRQSKADRPCKVHLIVSGDTYDAIARQNTVTINDLER